MQWSHQFYSYLHNHFFTFNRRAAGLSDKYYKEVERKVQVLPGLLNWRTEEMEEINQINKQTIHVLFGLTYELPSV